MREIPFMVFFALLAASQARPEGGYSYPQQQQQLQLPQYANQISGVSQQHSQIQPQAPGLVPVISQAPLPQANLVPYNPPLQQNTLHLLPVTNQISLNQHQQSVPFQQALPQFVQPLRQPVTHLLPQQEQFAGPSQVIQGQPQVAQFDISQLPIQPNQIVIPNLQAPQVQQGFNAPAVALPQIPLQQPALPQAEPSVIKHIYVHVAPEEPLSLQNIPPPSPPRKHYKIIFIKTPSQTTTHQQQVIQSVPSPAVEEKTLIYVLVKKPQHQEVVVQPPVKQPSKPEVYFIKYKAKPEVSAPGATLGAVNSQLLANNNLRNGQNPVQLINSGESTSSLISGGLPAQGTKYGPPGYQKRNA